MGDDSNTIVVRLRSGASISLALVCLVIAALGLAAAVVIHWTNFAIFVVAALGAAYWLYLAIRRPAGLILDEEGIRITLRYRWRRLGKILWYDIARAEMIDGPLASSTELALTLKDPDKYLGEFSWRERTDFTDDLEEADVTFPLGGLDMEPEELEDILRRHVQMA